MTTNRPKLHGRIIDMAPMRPWSVDPSANVWGSATLLAVATSSDVVPPYGESRLFDVSASMMRLLLRDQRLAVVGYEPLPIRSLQVVHGSALATIFRADAVWTLDDRYEVDTPLGVFDVTADVKAVLNARSRGILAGFMEYTQPTPTWIVHDSKHALVLPNRGEYPAIDASVRSQVRSFMSEPLKQKSSSDTDSNRTFSFTPAWDPRHFSVEVLKAETSMRIEHGEEDSVVISLPESANLSAPHMAALDDGTCLVQLQLYGKGEVVITLPPHSDFAAAEEPQRVADQVAKRRIGPNLRLL